MTFDHLRCACAWIQVDRADASNWYWAIRHAGSDAWGTCPARRIAQWYRDVGQDAFWYYWVHVADGPNGCGGAHHALEQPFVFHVLNETPVCTTRIVLYIDVPCATLYSDERILVVCG